MGGCEVGNTCKLQGGFAFKSSDARDEGIKWVKIANVGVNKIKWDDESFLPLGFEKKHSDFVLNTNDIVIAMTRPILSGKLKIAKINNSDSGSILNQRVGRIIPKLNIENNFAYQVFNSIGFINSMEKELLGTDPPNISSVMFESLLMVLPPLPEQQKIASILSTVDNKIEIIDQQISETKELKKGLMQKLLTKGIGHTAFKDSALGEIPLDWEVVKIEQEAKVITGSKDTQDRIDDGDYPFYVRSNTIERINSFSFDGEAVLTSGDGVGVGKIYHYLNEKFDYHQRVYNIHDFSKNLDGNFFYFYFSQHFYKRVMRLNAKNSVDSVRRAMITEMNIPLPPIPEQLKIATILSTVDEKLEVLKAKKDEYSELKKGLMQVLLTGRVRVTTN